MKRKNKKKIRKLSRNSYDVNSKRLLTNKSLLSGIMEYCIPEYKNLSRQEIIDCIEDGNNSSHIKGINVESFNDDNKEVKFDVLFTSRLPNSNEQIGMYIDVEPQNRISPGYNLINRAIYYVSRIMDNQKGKTFSKDDYDKIQKVYSIWICTNPKVEQRDSINYYSFNEEQVKGSYSCDIDYKKLNIIMLYLGQDYNFDTTGILELLNLIFVNTSYDSATKVKMLNDDYDILVSEKEVSDMSDYDLGLIEQGLQQGLQEGVINTIINVIDSGIPQDEAFKITKADENIKQAVLEKLKEER